MLVGNKSDLQADRVISYAQGEELAKLWNIPFVEASALRDTNVQQVFMTLPTKICKHEDANPPKPVKQSKCAIF